MSIFDAILELMAIIAIARIGYNTEVIRNNLEDEE